jgi:hypothetical protein
MVEPNDQGALLIHFLWLQALVARDQQLAATAQAVTDTAVGNQAAAIGATPLSLGSTSGGVYRVHLLARVTTPATVSSSLTVTMRWTVGGVNLSRTYAALTGNTTATYLIDIFAARIDPSTALTYETAYASVGGTVMRYGLELLVERLA